MNLHLDNSLAVGYTSGAQIARRLTEGWINANMYCPRCGNVRVEQCENNKPVSDFVCPVCENVFELKSKKGSLGEKITDGAYVKMIERIKSDTNPDFLFLGYCGEQMRVNDLILIPKYFFVPSVIEKRSPLASTARRAGWVGCNLVLSAIPKQGRVYIITGGEVTPKKQVIEQLAQTSNLARGDFKTRGWLFDVLNCVNAVQNDEFTLQEMYKFEDMLAKAHPDNHNIRAKIRQQLQFLRDAGYIEFLRPGEYRRIH